MLPTVVATPLWLWLGPVPIRGMGALADFSLRPADLLFGMLFTLIGILGIGLPSVVFVIGRKWPLGIRVVVLLLAGAAGGCLVAMLYVLLLLLSAHGLDWESIAGIPVVAFSGLLPGVVVSGVWMAMNLDVLRLQKRGSPNG